MLPRMNLVLSRLRHEITQSLSREAITDACRDVGHRWRDRTLNPVTTVYICSYSRFFTAIPLVSTSFISGLGGSRSRLIARLGSDCRWPLFNYCSSASQPR